MRAAAEAAAGSKAEKIRNDVIYASHVLKYGGGPSNTGFGLGASSYLGLGNSLTGIAALDSIMLPTAHTNTYAQVSDKLN